MNYTKVIAISGASGAGKSTIVKQLAKEFNSPFILFDHHFRDIYISAVNQVRTNSDLIMHEIASIKDTTNSISKWLKSNAN